AIVITAGTFLRGLLHVGEQSKPGGRMADASSSLSDSIRALGFEAGRFKTGTPCRLNANSIDYSSLDVQVGDDPPPRLSFLDRVLGEKDESFTLNFNEAGTFHVEQLPCWLTRTTPETHYIISTNLYRSPLYQRKIDRKSTRLNSSHSQISYAVFCLKKKNQQAANHIHQHHNDAGLSVHKD